jgi:hypothetical protein
MLSDTAELMYGAERTYAGMVFHGDVTGQSGAVGQNAVVPDGAVVTDMGIGHDQTVAAYPRSSAAALGSPRDGDTFADGVVIADFKAGEFAPVLEILGRYAQAGKGINAVPGAQAGLAIEYYVGNQLAVLAQDYIRTNGAIGANVTGLRDRSRGSHDGCWVNTHS